MNLKTAFIALSFCAVHSVSVSAPVRLDIEGAHIIVIRPIDRWSGNAASSDYSIKEYAKKKIAFFYFDEKGKKTLGSAGFFSKPEDNMLATVVQRELAQYGFTNNGPSGVAFVVDRPINLSIKSVPTFLKAQDILYRSAVIHQGDPETLESRISDKRVLGTVFAIAAAGYGMNKLGAVSGSQFIFSSGIADDVSGFTKDESLAISPIPSYEFDATQYSTVEVRKVSYGSDRVGQILIAYRHEKTSDVEREALAKAIVIASGADSSSDAIIAARSNDLAERVEIWNACQATATCTEKN